MKRWKQTFKQWLTREMDLPADVLMDVPRITMIGQLHLYIENHRGVLHFTKTQIRLRLTQGELLVEGKEFVIKSILPEELLLEGVIDKVTYITEQNGGER
ncbi:sporulation protein YqfC [Thalassorhabdus alkalitolerans]|uniref:Sporulation protein YqfC n=1 Tax=Thalassorhabdus alkalitolerans TaxID=2282697 RepID=A0ABW0YMN9_9BACI|nr:MULTISPECIES: sporulation protein YqfC [Bacillaceae]